MLITQVDLVNGSRVLLLEDFFPADLIAQLQQICLEYPASDVWTVPFGFDSTTARRSYTGPGLAAVKAWLASAECTDQLSARVGRPIEYSDLHLWCDPPGVDQLAPHKEQGGEYLAQFFVADVEHSYTGTTVYNDDGRILFQMPYRNNYGWFFSTGRTVMHGREHPVPAGINRFSLLVWYQTLISCI